MDELRAIDEVSLKSVVGRLPKKYDAELVVTGPLEFANLTVADVLRTEAVSSFFFVFNIELIKRLLNKYILVWFSHCWFCSQRNHLMVSQYTVRAFNFEPQKIFEFLFMTRVLSSNASSNKFNEY